MRKSFLLYLFLFTALFALFVYVSGSRKIASLQEDLTETQVELDSLKEVAVKSPAETVTAGETFDLMSNDAALNYFEQRSIDPEVVQKKVEAAIIARNELEADNDLVPYEGMEGFFRINKVKLLNHKWAIASFTDGVYWGEVFISYDIQGNNLELVTEDAFLYPL